MIAFFSRHICFFQVGSCKSKKILHIASFERKQHQQIQKIESERRRKGQIRKKQKHTFACFHEARRQAWSLIIWSFAKIVIKIQYIFNCLIMIYTQTSTTRTRWCAHQSYLTQAQSQISKRGVYRWEINQWFCWCTKRQK